MSKVDDFVAFSHGASYHNKIVNKYLWYRNYKSNVLLTCDAVKKSRDTKYIVYILL